MNSALAASGTTTAASAALTKSPAMNSGKRKIKRALRSETTALAAKQQRSTALTRSSRRAPQL